MGRMCTSILRARSYVKLFSVKISPPLAIDYDGAFKRGLVSKRVTHTQKKKKQKQKQKTKQNKKTMSGHSVPLRYCILFSVPEFPV